MPLTIFHDPSEGITSVGYGGSVCSMLGGNNAPHGIAPPLVRASGDSGATGMANDIWISGKYQKKKKIVSLRTDNEDEFIVTYFYFA